MATKVYEKIEVTGALKEMGFDTLLKALKAADLMDALESAENITIFAPNNEAFEKLEKSVLQDLLKEENREKLSDILKYHVISSEIPSDTVVSFDSIEMMNGHDAEILKRNGSVLINDAEIIETDIKAKNGMIHVIDRVLMPE